ncbi:MAG: hypothetical protein ABIH86_05790 [Planctomycetota bacterium]
MVDPVLSELWRIKDEIAKESDYNLDNLFSLLKLKQKRRIARNANKEKKTGDKNPSDITG